MAEKALTAVIQEAQGVSTRSVDDLVKAKERSKERTS
jgi:transposase-like protein